MTPPHKGIILAGGLGTRLGELTRTSSKHLLPVHGRPMVHYPLAALMLAGIRDILLISTPHHLPGYQDLLGDGSNLGISLTYAPQPTPAGIAQAPLIAEPFLAGAPSVLALGDNLFLGDLTFLKNALTPNTGATVFTRTVAHPENYGVAELGPANEVLSLQEKPTTPKSNNAITGLYILDADAPSHAATLTPSPRGELEITDLLQRYLDNSTLRAIPLPDSVTWHDAGTPASLQAATAAAKSNPRPALKTIALEMGYLT